MRPLHVDLKGIYKGSLEFVAGLPGEVQAVMYGRPMMLVHGFDIIPGLPPLRRYQLAQALSTFGQGYIRHRQFEPCGCLFHISPGNVTMEEFARTLGGKPEQGQTYRIDYAGGDNGT